MRRSALAAAALVLAAPALAAATALPADAPAAGAPAPEPGSPTTAEVPAGIRVVVEIGEAVSTRTHKRGDWFLIALSDPVVVGGQVIVPAGALGRGQVVDVRKPDFGGKPGRLVLAARYVDHGGRRLPLGGFSFGARGEENTAESGLLRFVPYAGRAAFFIKGGEVEIPPGTLGEAVVATAGDAAAGPPPGAEPDDPTEEASAGEAWPMNRYAQPAPPPPGKGLVVFFRPRKFLGSNWRYGVREGDTKLARLRNGSYAVHVADPGTHTYSTQLENADSLTVEVAPGQVTYVLQSVASGFFFSYSPYLAPSDEAAFRAKFRSLKPAKPLSAASGQAGQASVSQ